MRGGLSHLSQEKRVLRGPFFILEGAVRYELLAFRHFFWYNMGSNTYLQLG